MTASNSKDQASSTGAERQDASTNDATADISPSVETIPLPPKTSFEEAALYDETIVFEKVAEKNNMDQGGAGSPPRAGAAGRPPKMPSPPRQSPPLVPPSTNRDVLLTNNNPSINLAVALNGSRATKDAMNGPDTLLERDVEDSLLRIIEDRNPINPSEETGHNILPGLPIDELKHDFQEPEEIQKSPFSEASKKQEKSTPTRSQLMTADQNNRKSFKNAVNRHRRNMTVTEALFGLTAALDAVQLEGSNEAFVTSQDYDSEITAADRLAADADRMINGIRNRKETHQIDATTTENLSVANEQILGQSSTKDSGAIDDRDKHKKDDDYNVELNKPDEPTGDLESGRQETMWTDSKEMLTPNKRDGKSHTRHNPFKRLPGAHKIKKEWDQFNSFLTPRKASIYAYARYIVFYLWVPALAVSALLFHVFENPPTGVRSENLEKSTSDTDELFGSSSADTVEFVAKLIEAIEAGDIGNATLDVQDDLFSNPPRNNPVEKISSKASVSWWIIFICIRQVSIVIMAKGLQAVIVDFLALQTKAMLTVFGPMITLLFVQSQGWPFLMTFWGILNLCLVTGASPFNRHWLYWQKVWGLFNEDNPAGDITNTLWLLRISKIASIVGGLVAAKRVLVGIYLGRKTFAQFSDSLAKVMNRMLQVSQVAKLSKTIEKGRRLDSNQLKKNGSAEKLSDDNLLQWMPSARSGYAGESAPNTGEPLTPSRIEQAGDGYERVIDTEDVDPYTGRLRDEQKARIAEILGSWEEPGRSFATTKSIPVASVLQFRRALAHMDTPSPFSTAFGLADTREQCIASAQIVYERLIMANDSESPKLNFNTLATLAVRKNGSLDQELTKDLIRTFRPERDGTISMVDFVRSIDSIYRDLRMLRATVASSSKIDQALETIFNFFFYAIVLIIILSVLEIDPLALFLSLSSIILAFAFMIGSASAKYFEGLLFILFQRPYGIGDRINVSNPESKADNGGSQGWIVEDVNLFTTTIYLGATNERATISNGSLAKSRIINGARSPKAILLLNLKFGVEVPYSRLEIFRDAVESFVRARPREWLSLIAIRAGRVEADLGFIEYCVALQHRESWQNTGPVLDSKHSIYCFMLELTKKLDLTYKSPPLPILLNRDGFTPTPAIEAKYDFETHFNEHQDIHHQRTASDDVRDVAALFDAGAE